MLRTLGILFFILQSPVPIGGVFTMLRQREQSLLNLQLRPLETAAIRLAKSSASSVLSTTLAHSYMVAYDRFIHPVHLHGHGWEPLLARSLCNAYVALPPDALFDLDADATECVGEGAAEMLRACHSHVVPWHAGHGMCSAALRMPVCRERHPLRELCRRSHRLVHSKQRNQHKLKSVDALSHYGVEAGMHPDWHSYTRHQKRKAFHDDVHSRKSAHLAFHADAKPAKRSALESGKPVNGRRSSAPIGRTLQAAALVGDGKFAPRHLHATRGKGARLCSAHPLLRDVLSEIYTASSIRLVIHPGRSVAECDVLFAWRTEAALRREETPGTWHSPDRHLFTLAPRQRYDAVVDEATRSREIACSRLHATTRHGRYPGHGNKILSRDCGVFA